MQIRTNSTLNKSSDYFPTEKQNTPSEARTPPLKPIHHLKMYLARQYTKLYPRDLFIGVAGSVGKTTCVEACVAVLSKKFNTLATPSDFDSSLNTSGTLLKLTPKTKKVILEMGVEYKGDMDFHLSQVQPSTVIYIKIAYDNSEYLGSLDEIIEEQGKLIKQLDEKGIAILNFDDPACKKLANDCKGSVIYFGTDSQNCTVWAGNVKVENFRTSFELNLGVERVKVNLPLCGSHQVYSSLAAAALGVVNDIPLTKIKLALESIQPLEHRMQVVIGPDDSVILDDTINSSPAAMDVAIDTLLSVNARRRIVVLGEMRNLGKNSEDLHRQMAQKIFKEKIDLVFLGQGEAEIIAEELKSLGFWEERISSNLQNSQIVSKLLKVLRKGDVVLIKGSQSIRLDEVVKRIAKKNT